MFSSQVILATERELPSLSTIIPRSFHSTSEQFRTTFPDTPLIRHWWKSIFSDAIQDPTYRVLVIKEDNARVPGMLLLHSGPDPAVFKRHPITPDHNKDRWKSMIEAEMDPKGSEAKPHFRIELLGVDSECQGKGYGKELLQEACRIALEDGLDVHVSANLKAKAFYERAGFVCRNVVTLPGSGGYQQAFLVYSVESESVMLG